MENARGNARTRNSALELSNAATAGPIVMMARMNVIVSTLAATNSVLAALFFQSLENASMADQFTTGKNSMSNYRGCNYSKVTISSKQFQLNNSNLTILT